jgi:hypothetical protein
MAFMMARSSSFLSVIPDKGTVDLQGAEGVVFQPRQGSLTHTEIIDRKVESMRS